METPRVPLYNHLPEIYRIRDEEQDPPGQLRAYLSLVERAFSAIHENIEALYGDLFIETSSDWVVPYIGDLLGVSHLTGDPWTLRTDIADTIALRRRKGTLASIERLVYNLTRWGVHFRELRDSLVWNQHLNHQRPDAGGEPPYAQPGVTRFSPVRGGTVTLRDPAMLSLLGTPFDPFAHVADVKPPARAAADQLAVGAPRYNLPNLAIFLWRLQSYQVPFARPFTRGVQEVTSPAAGEAAYVLRLEIDPLGRPVQLFNTYSFDPDLDPPVVTGLDSTPGPIPAARLDDDAVAGNPAAYLAVDTYDPGGDIRSSLDGAEVGLQFHLPEPAFTSQTWPGLDPAVWCIRAENLCAWESGMLPPVHNREIVIDPRIGRALIGVDRAGEAQALERDLLVTYTYGAPGPVGAHPSERPDAPKEIDENTMTKIEVLYHQSPDRLRHAILERPAKVPIVIEIQDSATYDLDLSLDTDGFNLRLNMPVIIRAASGQRPVIRLGGPLKIGPTSLREDEGANWDDREEDTREQGEERLAKARNSNLRLEGLFLTRGESFPAGEPLIARAALNRLELAECTLDPGGYRQLDETRAPLQAAMRLADEPHFPLIPVIILDHCLSGPIQIDRTYDLTLQRSILDAGFGPADPPAEGQGYALSGTGDPANTWGPPTQVNCMTVLGRMRVEHINGRGGIWSHSLEVLDNQHGCLRYSCFSGVGDRLPQNLGCVSTQDTALRFSGETFGHPAYAQLALTSDFRIQERGPDNAAMGAFNFLQDAHKWRNLQIRFREFLPVGVRPLLIPVT